MTQKYSKTIRVAATLALATAGAWTLPCAHAGDAVAAQVRVQMTFSQITVEGSLNVPVSRAVAWQVLTDHEGFPAFVPGLQESRVIELRGGEKIVAQRGEITAGPRLRFEGVLRVEERPGEGVRIRFLSGPFKDSDGEWQLGGDRPISLSYRLRIDLDKSPMPPPMAGALAEQQVRVWLSALAGEMERRQGRK